jgi:serpin B
MEVTMKALLSLLIACSVLPVAACAAEASPMVANNQAAVVDGNNEFAVALYGKLRSQSGNLFFSPESVSTALAMTYAGARGDTASEMAKTLRFTLPPDQLHPAMGALLEGLNASHDGYQLRVANALWAQQDYKFRDDFLKLTESDYGAGLNQVDFRGATEVARLTINQWVEQKTENKIKDLLKPGVLSPATRLVLTDAIYFKADWQTQFHKEATTVEDFHLAPAQTIKAPLMHKTGGYNYFNGGTFQIVEIPYKSRDLSMIIFLPKDVDGLSAFEQSLTASNMQKWLSQLKPVSRVIVTFPKFKVTQQFELGGVLGAMGMPSAFKLGAADFSGMTGNRELFISAVIHKAFVDVDEAGTEAAAATAVAMVGMAMRAPDPTPPTEFRADHPFVFLIRDNRSGSILFMGRVTDPTK